MTFLSREEIEVLLNTSSGPSISIYLPTVRAGAETQQNPIRFKNLVREAEQKLLARGVAKAELEELLEPLRRLIDDQPFWQHQEEGLGVFRTRDAFHRYRLPVSLEELVVVNERLHLKPLFSLLSGDGHFFILALSMNDIRLFDASRYSIREIDLGDTPRSLVDALGEELEEAHLQFHTGTSSTTGVRGDRAAVFHTQGGGEEDQKPEIAKFFHLVDRGVQERLRDRNAPLVLAGVEYLLPIYREASGHPNLLEGVTGNPQDVPPEELRDRAWEIAKPLVLTRRQEEAERFRAMLGTGRASSQIEEVVVAAADGRVDTLFVARGEQRWGRFEPGDRRVRSDQDPQPDNEDLLDLAAVRTYLNGGTVYVLDPERLPSPGEPVAALYRY